jgi:hypothetical protein
MKFKSIAGADFPVTPTSVTVVELLLALGAASLTAAIWLSIGAWAIPQGNAIPAAQAAEPASVVYVTLPRVEIVGHRDTWASTPATTTAQNTAAFPVNLHQ